jgi:DNA-binding GntR family transcriptional regulator
MSIRIRYFPEVSKAMHQQVVEEVLSEHLHIIEAFKARDGDKLIDAVKLHLRNGEKRAMAALLRQ